MRETSTGIGTLPLRKPGILTLAARSVAACSTAWWTSALGTSTVSRTLLSGSSSTCVGIEPLEQTATNLGHSAALRDRPARRVDPQLREPRQRRSGGARASHGQGPGRGDATGAAACARAARTLLAHAVLAHA